MIDRVQFLTHEEHSALSLSLLLYQSHGPAQAGKLTPENAKLEFGRAVKGAKSNIANVEAMEEAEQRERLAALRRERQNLELDEVMCAWRSFPQWDQWLIEQSKVRLRQNLFVITGPSKMGKSQFLLHSLGGDGGTSVLLVNCMNVLDPDLRDYKSAVHSAIIFDEGGPEMVQRHRDLFQAPRHDIKLAHSQTGCYCYSVNLWRVKLVVTCNGWADQLQRLDNADKEWVCANTTVLEVSEPMWQ